MKTQGGAALVEFAIMAMVFFIILFGIIEFGRTLFTYNMLVEATRRGARVAAVCPADSASITQVQQTTYFDATRSQATGMFGLTAANVVVKYLDSTMNTSPAIVASDGSNSSPTSISSSDKDANGVYLYDKIAFVRVQLQNVNAINLIIPALSLSIPVPPIVTTLPSESLGRNSSTNPPTRVCKYS